MLVGSGLLQRCADFQGNCYRSILEQSNSFAGGWEACVMLCPCLGVFSWIASCNDLSTDSQGKVTGNESCVMPEMEGGQSGRSE